MKLKIAYLIILFLANHLSDSTKFSLYTKQVLLTVNSIFIFVVLHLSKTEEDEYKVYPQALSQCSSTHDRASARDFYPTPCKLQTMSTSSPLACKHPCLDRTKISRILSLFKHIVYLFVYHTNFASLSPITTSANFGLLFNCFLPCTIFHII